MPTLCRGCRKERSFQCAGGRCGRMAYAPEFRPGGRIGIETGDELAHAHYFTPRWSSSLRSPPPPRKAVPPKKPDPSSVQQSPDWSAGFLRGIDETKSKLDGRGVRPAAARRRRRLPRAGVFRNILGRSGPSLSRWQCSCSIPNRRHTLSADTGSRLGTTRSAPACRSDCVHLGHSPLGDNPQPFRGDQEPLRVGFAALGVLAGNHHC